MNLNRDEFLDNKTKEIFDLFTQLLMNGTQLPPVGQRDPKYRIKDILDEVWSLGWKHSKDHVLNNIKHFIEDYK